MQRAGRLLDLQQVDLELDSLDGRLSTISSLLGESDQLKAVKADFAAAELLSKKLESQRKEIDEEVVKVRDKRRREESRLYSGVVQAPKEIQGLQQEIASLAKRLLELEDAELELMGQIEEADAARTAAAERLASVTAEWQDEQARLREEQAQLTAGRVDLVQKREDALVRVDPTDIPMYNSMRRLLGGRPIARIDRGTCSGCRITLPSTELQKARSSPTMIKCSSCHRILFGG